MSKTFIQGESVPLPEEVVSFSLTRGGGGEIVLRGTVVSGPGSSGDLVHIFADGSVTINTTVGIALGLTSLTQVS